MINIYDYFEKQRTLDKTIMDKFGTKIDDIVHKQVFAFMVEVGEFANETRVFKHWSQKAMSPPDVLLDEYADALHFLLSFSYMYMDAYFPEEPEWLIWEKLVDFIPAYVIDTLNEEDIHDPKDAVLHFLNGCFYLASNLMYPKQETVYSFLSGLWLSFLAVAYCMNFTLDEIFEAYDKKHEINYARQDANY